MRWVAVFTLTVAGFGVLAGLGLWVSATAVLMLGIGVPAMLVAEQRLRPAEQANEPPRPDADVAQYLNDDDRAWLKQWSDWSPPRPPEVARAEPKRSSWQTDLDRRVRAQLPLAQQPRMAAGGARVRVTPSTGSASYHVTRRPTLREGMDDRQLIPVPRNVNLVIPNDLEREAVMTLAATVLKARVPVGSIRDGDSIPVRLCVTCDGLHTPVTVLRTCTC